MRTLANYKGCIVTLRQQIKKSKNGAFRQELKQALRFAQCKVAILEAQLFGKVEK